MAPPPELIDDAIAEILLRLPPDDPACLVRASMVCKLWRRILSHPTFPHCYREFHRWPPLLGLVRSSSGGKHSRFFPIEERTPLLQPAFRFRQCRALDCRHGRVIFDAVYDTREKLIVWDPITGDDMFLSDPDPRSLIRSGVVLCAADGCNHRGCHGGPFLVVFLTTSFKDDTSIARAWLYSSESAAWSAPASMQLPYHSFFQRKRAAIVGNQLHFLLNTSAGILKYDIVKHHLTTIESPAAGMHTRNDILMTMEDGSSLGFASIMDSTLHLWKRKMNRNRSMGWVQDKVVLLNDIVPIFQTKDTYNMDVIGFAEGLDILLLGKHPSRLFMFSLKSGKFTKLSNNKYDYEDVFPYTSFYIPDFDSCKLPLSAETDEA